MTGQLSFLDYKPEPSPSETDPIQALEPIELLKDKPGAKLAELVPDGASLELNRHYEIRAIHVGRILAALGEKLAAGGTLTRDQIARQLSMTRALTDGTMNVMRRMELVDTKTRITSLGALSLAYSPYLDNIGLLWLLHYLLASNARLVLWSNLFNLSLHNYEELSLQQIAESFRPLQGRWSPKTMDDKIPLELNGILKTYTQALFAPLGLLHKSDTGFYQGSWDAAGMPLLVWLSVILAYRDRYYSGASALETPLIVRGHYSPGRILRQNEATLRRTLDELHNAGLLTVETRSGLDQVRFKREHTWLSAAARHLRREATR
jgi:hypothetical protein